jgi:hypothetical protein
VRKRVLVALAAVAAIAVLVPAIALTQGRARADLVVSASSEPRDFVVRGERLTLTVTVSNQGTRRARRSRLAAYLVGEPVTQPPSGAEPVEATRAVGPVRRAGQRTQRMRITIPAAQPAGVYYLLICADDGGTVREKSERNNCRLSGQALRVGLDESDRGGPRGPAGPAGPAGPKGDAGAPGLEVFSFARTTLPLGTANVDDVRDDDQEATGNGPNDGQQGTPDEGSTEKKTVMQVGPFEFRVLCRQQTDPNEDDQNYDTTGAEGRLAEAKILVYTSEGTFSSEGRQGARTNITAGEGVPGAEGGGGGEGKHQIMTAAKHRDGGFGQGEEDNFNSDLNGYNVILVHSNGWEVMFDGYVGLDVLGAGEPGSGNQDQCVFAGSATVINKP